jgi:hypothetical protein
MSIGIWELAVAGIVVHQKSFRPWRFFQHLLAFGFGPGPPVFFDPEIIGPSRKDGQTQNDENASCVTAAHIHLLI